LDAASHYFGHRLSKMIEEKQAEMIKRLLQGVAVDYADYKDRSGYLRALSDVVDWMDQISMADEKRENRP
jgi:hypothetical protein